MAEGHRQTETQALCGEGKDLCTSSEELSSSASSPSHKKLSEFALGHPHNSPVSQLLIFALGISAVLLQFYILLRPKSSHYCSQPLLYNLVGSIVFTFFALGLALLLVTIEPVPWELRMAFAAFGVASFAEGACTTALTASARQCARTTPELYYLSVTLSVSCTISAAFFSFLGFFWIANIVSPGLVLKKDKKAGICYKPVSECSCLWHV